MRWGDVVDAFVAEITADPTLRTLLGWDAGDPDAMRFHLAEEREFDPNALPLLDYEFLTDFDRFEVFEGVLVQFNSISRNLSDTIAISSRLRCMFDHNTEVTIQGVRMWAEWQGGAPLLGADDGIRGRSNDFRFTPVKAVYES